MLAARFETAVNRLAYLVIGAMLALILWITGSPEQCMSIDALSMPESTTQELVTSGWFGLPTDGEERLYSPACRVTFGP